MATAKNFGFEERFFCIDANTALTFSYIVPYSFAKTYPEIKKARFRAFFNNFSSENH